MPAFRERDSGTDPAVPSTAVIFAPRNGEPAPRTPSARGCGSTFASPTKLKVTCRIAKTFSDEIESEIEDPQQPKLP